MFVDLEREMETGCVDLVCLRECPKGSEIERKDGLEALEREEGGRRGRRVG